MQTGSGISQNNVNATQIQRHENHVYIIHLFINQNQILMKKRKFEVTPEQMADFAELISELELVNEIAGKTDDGDIIVNVFYEKDDSDKVLELMEWLDEVETEDED